jgi:tetratricopeptide (TPR) repeat protein
VSEQVLRLFVSSPGDVMPERQRVDLVVERLNAEFEGLARIETVRWETAYYSAHDTFQKQIPEAANCDVVIAIFRTRLGSKLPATFPTQPSGEPYPSGTAYEILSALEWRKTSGQVPDVYVFRYPRAPSVELDAPNREEIAGQWNQLKNFFETWFLNTSGEFLAAFQDYSSTDDFAVKVEDCLRQWLARRGFVAQGPVWDRILHGSPFPGLSAFEAEHGPVFFGRDLAIAQAVERLRQAGAEQAEGRPARASFLLIIGASGSGKSSLLRAGLLPRLTLPGTIPEIDLWRTAVVMPGPDPFLALAESLLAEAALGPELRQSAFVDKALLAKQLAGDPELAMAPLREALRKAAERRKADAHFDEARPARIALGIDQAERIFTEASAAAATSFAVLMAALVNGGLAYVIFTMRSDTYARFQSFEALVALREAGATLDLVPPNAAELEEIVTGPVEACHPPLAFEQADGRSLAAMLVADTKGGDALPLLQMTLSRLYAAEEVRGDGVLRIADYRGMDAAVTETANEALESLGAEERAALPALIAGLVADVTVDPTTREQTPIISALDRRQFEAGRPARRALVETFVAKRLLTTDGDGALERLRPVHEALLRIWPQAVAIIAEAGNLFRVRRTLQPIVRDWESAADGDKARHLDISPALLSGAQLLVARFSTDLPLEMRSFIAASAAAAEAREHQEREAQERRLHDAEALAAANRRVARGAVAGLAVALMLVALAGWQWRVAQAERDVARKTVAVATDAANGLVFDMADKFRNVFGVPAATVKDILGQASDLQEKLVIVAGANPQIRLSQAHALIKTAETLLDLGETKSALTAATTAQTITRDLANKHPDIAEYRRTLARADETVGNVRVRQGNAPEALKAFQAGLALREDLAKAADAKPIIQRELAQSHRSIGDMLFRQGKLPEAMDAYQSGFSIRQKLAADHPDDLGWQIDLSTSYQKIGNVLAAQGKLAEAMKSYQASLAIRDRLAKTDPDNPSLQNDLAQAYSSVGDMLVKQGNLAEAMKAYQPELAIVDRLAKSDPGHASWQNDLSNADVKIGEVLAAEENLPEAMKYYQASLTIRDRLVKADPENAIWERNIAVSHERVGDVLVAQGNLAEAMTAYKTSLGIRDRLVKSDPTNAVWEHDLAVSYASTGDVLIEQEKLSDAMQAYRRAKDTIDGLSAANPGNATWLRDLSNIEIRIGDILLEETALVDALQSYQAGVAINERLAKIDPGNELWQHALSVSYDRVGDVMVRQGNLDEALRASMAGLAIADRLAKTGTGNAGWQNDLADSYIRVGEAPDRQDDVSDNGVSNHTGGGIGNRLLSSNASNADWQNHLASSHNRVGEVQFAKGDLTEAMTSYQASLAITDQLAKADPGNARAQYNLSVAHEFIAEVLAAQGHLPEALAAYQVSLAIRDKLAKDDPSNAGWRDSLSAAYENIGDVLMKQNKLPDAIKSYQASLTIREALAKADPADADWQHDLSASYASLADVYHKQGKVADARAALAMGRAIVAPYASQHPESADWKKDLAWFDQQIAEVGK